MSLDPHLREHIAVSRILDASVDSEPQLVALDRLASFAPTVTTAPLRSHVAPSAPRQLRQRRARRAPALLPTWGELGCAAAVGLTPPLVVGVVGVAVWLLT